MLPFEKRSIGTRISSGMEHQHQHANFPLQICFQMPRGLLEGSLCSWWPNWLVSGWVIGGYCAGLTNPVKTLFTMVGKNVKISRQGWSLETNIVGLSILFLAWGLMRVGTETIPRFLSLTVKLPYNFTSERDLNVQTLIKVSRHQMSKSKKQAGAELCQVQHSLSLELDTN